MKTLFLTVFLLIGLSTGNFLLLQNSCRAKSLTETTKNDLKSGKPELPTPTPTSSPIEWIPSAYSGITPGKTTYKEVVKIFGKPKGESNPEGETDLEEGAKDSAVLLEYPNDENESFDLVLDGKTKIVEYLTVYNRVRPTKQEIISKYGDGYFEIESGESACLTAAQKRGASGRQNVSLVYPEKGLVIPIDQENKASIILYRYKCGE